MNAIKILVKGWVKVLPFYLFTLLPLFVSCSDDSEEVSEFDNWVEQNDAVISQWASSNSYQKFKSYTKDQAVAGNSSDYIYVRVLESGVGTESPLFNDTVRVAYRLRYIPTKSYPDGYMVGETYMGDFNWKTISVANLALTGSLIDGFNTAVMNMHIGDRWIINIPYSLGYGDPSTRDDILDGSNLIYDLALVDFWHPGETRPSFKSRER
ncbi:MAG: FKBP-type peptidyl-prolyl cis-trans isomerase [Prevotella sp.]|nr:FKBP-type peptidyl-prolyl cis-trans isomerase [Prevotella sp.]